MKKLLITVGVVAVLLVGGLLAARHFALGYLTPDFVVRYMESQWNCRVDIGSLDIKVGRNAVIELKEVAIGARDEHANAKTPLDERQPMEGANITIANVQLNARLGDLLKRHLNIEHLLISGAEISTAFTEEGRATIDTLFDSPSMGSAAGDPAAPATQALAAGETDGETAAPVTQALAVGETAGETEEKQDDKDAFVASDMKISTQAALVELRDSRVSATVLKNGAVVLLEDLEVVLKDIDLDPDNLIGHNSANFGIGATLIIEGAADAGRYLEWKLTGNGKVAPFNPETGAVEPAFTAELAFLQGSRVETFPLIEKLQTKLAAIDTGGVDLSEFNLRGELTSDASTQLAFRQGRFTLEQPLSLALPDTAFAFEPGSWADTGTNEHDIKGVVTASEELTGKIVAKVETYLKEKLGSTLADAALDTVLGLALKDGRIAIEFVSNGDLSKPKVDVVTPFGNLGDLKDTLDGLKDAFKGLFGK